MVAWLCDIVQSRGTEQFVYVCIWFRKFLVFLLVHIPLIVCQSIIFLCSFLSRGAFHVVSFV